MYQILAHLALSPTTIDNLTHTTALWPDFFEMHIKFSENQRFLRIVTFAINLQVRQAVTKSCQNVESKRAIFLLKKYFRLSGQATFSLAWVKLSMVVVDAPKFEWKHNDLKCWNRQFLFFFKRACFCNELQIFEISALSKRPKLKFGTLRDLSILYKPAKFHLRPLW